MKRRRRTRSGCDGSRSRSATSASRMPRSSSSSLRDQFQRDVGIEFEKLAEARRQPIRADAERRRDAQFAVRLLAIVASRVCTASSLVITSWTVRRGHRPARSGSGRAHGDGTAAPAAPLERADLPADRRLAQAQRFAGMRERARLGGRVENPQLVPVQNASSPASGACATRSIPRRSWSPLRASASARPRAPPCSPGRRR